MYALCEVLNAPLESPDDQDNNQYEAENADASTGTPSGVTVISSSSTYQKQH
jgi:hypothetical protein